MTPRTVRRHMLAAFAAASLAIGAAGGPARAQSDAAAAPSDLETVVTELIARIDDDLTDVAELLFVDPNDADLLALRDQLNATRDQLLLLLGQSSAAASGAGAGGTDTSEE